MWGLPKVWGTAHSRSPFHIQKHLHEETLTRCGPVWRRSISGAVLLQLRWNCFHYCDRAAGFIVFKCLQQPSPIPVKPWMSGSGSSVRLLPLRRLPVVTKQLVDVGDLRSLVCDSRQGRHAAFCRSISPFVENSATALSVGRSLLEKGASLEWLQCTMAWCKRGARVLLSCKTGHCCCIWPSYAVWAVGGYWI